jgi:hypothetical protein
VIGHREKRDDLPSARAVEDPDIDDLNDKTGEEAVL